MCDVSDPVLHLARRAAWGPTPELVAEIRALGTKAWLDRQLRPAAIPDPQVDALLPRWPQLGWDIPTATRSTKGWDTMVALSSAALARACWSRRQLLEVLVDVWSNALNVTNPSGEVWGTRHRYDRDVIRKHALGRFDDMLVAAITHPAMLRFLDGASSNRWQPNENLGRELLELHTVGRASGYTERDVRDSARILTGLSVDWDRGTFVYRAQDHWTGPVRVLGFRHPNATPAGGRRVAEAYLRYLAHHPATALNVARRLAVRFVSDTPSAGLVRMLAATYRRNKTSIVPVLRALFGSAEFWASEGKKVRTPFESLVGAVRALGIAPPASGTQGVLGLYWESSNLGQPPLAWPRPDGYPDVAAAWTGAAGTVQRWTTHLGLAGQWNRELGHPDPKSWLPSPLPGSYAALIDAVAARLFVPALTDRQRAAICTFFERRPQDPVKQTDAVLHWRLAHLVALILDTPQAVLR
nr:DUF1800 domain-containing protein [Motilibacter deserti]